MERYRVVIIGIFSISWFFSFGQPQPCGPNPAMTSFCDNACVICDIDGFSGVNDLTAQGQGFTNFCTTQYNNMQYLAFIAGTPQLVIEVVVGTCLGGAGSLEVGFFESFDCETFTAISACDTDIEGPGSTVFTTDEDLVVGQHYYLVIDGSNGANCDWTFNVLEGSTEVLPLTTSGVITSVNETCPDFPTLFSTTVESGAAIFDWTINGVREGNISPIQEFSFPTEGVYDVCVTAANVCDEAPPSCTTILVRAPMTLNINEILCEGECVEANGIQFCETGIYQEVVILPNGCDSVINIDIEVFAVSETFVDIWLCSDQFFFIGTDGYNLTGSYIDTIPNEFNCDSIVSLELLVIECEISGTTDEVPVICNGDSTGTLTFSLTQGTPPFDYRVNALDGTLWATGNAIFVNAQVSGLPVGSYQIYIEDTFGNDVVLFQEITEPNPLAVDFTISDYNGFNISCNQTNGSPGDDGFAQLAVIGGVPQYEVLWNNGVIGERIDFLEEGIYTAEVTDDSGCKIVDSVALIAPSRVEVEISFENPSCDGFASGEIWIDEISGGTAPYLFALDSGSFQSDTLFTGLEEGIYEIVIQDANNCVSSGSLGLIAPEIPEILTLDDVEVELGRSVEINPILNNAIIGNIQWSDTITLDCGDCLEPMASPINDAAYVLTVTSADGCSATDSLNVFVLKVRNVFVPNAFSPNGDGLNDKLVVFGGPEVEKIASFNLYNRWGDVLLEKVDFLANDANEGWDARFKGKDVEPGIYVWTAVVDFIDGVSKPLSGSVLIVR